jgi:hypothetical protein
MRQPVDLADERAEGEREDQREGDVGDCESSGQVFEVREKVGQHGKLLLSLFRAARAAQSSEPFALVL